MNTSKNCKEYYVYFLFGFFQDYDFHMKNDCEGKTDRERVRERRQRKSEKVIETVRVSNNVPENGTCYRLYKIFRVLYVISYLTNKDLQLKLFLVSFSSKKKKHNKYDNFSWGMGSKAPSMFLS